MLPIHPHAGHTQVISSNVGGIDLVWESIPEGVGDIGIVGYTDLTTAQPRTQGDFNVLSTPSSHPCVHRTQIPPVLASGEHSHGDGGEVVRTTATSPENTQRPGEGGRTANTAVDGLWTVGLWI